MIAEVSGLEIDYETQGFSRIPSRKSVAVAQRPAINGSRKEKRGRVSYNRGGWRLLKCDRSQPFNLAIGEQDESRQDGEPRDDHQRIGSINCVTSSCVCRR